MQPPGGNRNFGPAILAFSALLLLTLLSLIFYKERMLFVDASWFAVNLLHQKSFFFTEYRFGAFVPQLAMLSGIYLGLPLKALLLLFSVSFYVFYLIAFAFIGFRWQQVQIAVLYVFYLLLFVSDGFFCTMGEIFQGVTWMFLFFALYFREGRKEIKLVLLPIFAFLSLICHMLLILPFAFLWLYLNADYFGFRNMIRQRNFRAYSLLLLVCAVTRYGVSNASWYDSAKMEPLHHLQLKGILNAFRSGQVRTFLQTIIANYWLNIPIIFLGLYWLLQKRKLPQLLLILVFSLAYLGLMGVVYPDAYDRSMLFYFENEWAPLSIILSTAFVYELFDRLKDTRKLSLLLGIILLIRIGYILESCSFFHQRYKNLERITESLHRDGLSKAIVLSDDALAKQTLLMNWGLPVESLLLSELKGYRPAITVKMVSVEEQISQLADTFYAPFDKRSHHFLNADYIHFDTMQRYQLVKHPERFELKHLGLQL